MPSLRVAVLFPLVFNLTYPKDSQAKRLMEESELARAQELVDCPVWIPTARA